MRTTVISTKTSILTTAPRAGEARQCAVLRHQPHGAVDKKSLNDDGMF